MIEKYKSALGLAAIIIGVGIAWIIVGKMLVPLVERSKVEIKNIYFEIEVSNIKESEVFYKDLLVNSIVDSVSEDSRMLTVKRSKVNLKQVHNVFRHKLNVEVNNIDHIKEYVTEKNIQHTMIDSTLNVLDPDSNLIIFKKSSLY